MTVGFTVGRRCRRCASPPPRSVASEHRLRKDVRLVRPTPPRDTISLSLHRGYHERETLLFFFFFFPSVILTLTLSLISLFLSTLFPFPSNILSSPTTTVWIFFFFLFFHSPTSRCRVYFLSRFFFSVPRSPTNPHPIPLHPSPSPARFPFFSINFTTHLVPSSPSSPFSRKRARARALVLLCYTSFSLSLFLSPFISFLPSFPPSLPNLPPPTYVPTHPLILSLSLPPLILSVYLARVLT